MKISVITVAYNSQASIGATIGSVLAQELPGSLEAEYLIIDGGSGDGTPAKAEAYRELLEEKGRYYRLYTGQFQLS